MPTISSTTTLTLAAGQAYVFLAGSGVGIAVADPGGRSAKYSIGPQQTAIGPFSTSVSVDVLITSGSIEYRVDTDGDLRDQDPAIAAQAAAIAAVGERLGAVEPEIAALSEAVALQSANRFWQSRTRQLERKLMIQSTGPSLLADFEKNEFFWGGSYRGITDLTANGDGSYSLAYDLGFAGSVTIELEYTMVDGAAPSGNLFSWTNASNQRMEVEVLTVPSNGEYTIRLFDGGASNYVNLLSKRPDHADPGASSGRRRTQFALSVGNPALSQSNNWPSRAEAWNVSALTAPTSIRFKGRARFADSPLTNCTLHRVTVWPRKFTAAETQISGITGDYYGVHLIGDSFLGQHRILSAVAKKVPAKYYVPITQDGVSGASLVDHAVRFAQDKVDFSGQDYDLTRLRESTLVICDFGLSDTAENAISSIASMVAKLPHDRWIFMEPAPSIGTDDPSRPTWDATVATIKAYVGDRFVPTLEPALAIGSDALTAVRKWPLALVTSTTDFHPNAAGQSLIGNLIYQALKDRGWAL